ncbi:hypothetical protein HYN86_12070 [Flavobacterium fluviale]|uniref:Uncharacterized protein n=1 Tax=Flavobacterium fluviale TaxID=2249356 RepID=A0A344LTP7_9FLAO|nr:hypothetical protein HYN86_12070 [Flavobacterium fluviale]
MYLSNINNIFQNSFMNLLCKGEAWKKGFMFHASCFMFEVSGFKFSCVCQAERSRSPLLLKMLKNFTAKFAKIFI